MLRSDAWTIMILLVSHIHCSPMEESQNPGPPRCSFPSLFVYYLSISIVDDSGRTTNA